MMSTKRSGRAFATLYNFLHPWRLFIWPAFGTLDKSTGQGATIFGQPSACKERGYMTAERLSSGFTHKYAIPRHYPILMRTGNHGEQCFLRKRRGSQALPSVHGAMKSYRITIDALSRRVTRVSIWHWSSAITNSLTASPRQLYLKNLLTTDRSTHAYVVRKFSDPGQPGHLTRSRSTTARTLLASSRVAHSVSLAAKSSRNTSAS